MTEPRHHDGEGMWLPVLQSRGVVVSGRWLLRMRWIAGGAVLVGTVLAAVFLPVRLPTTPLLLTGAAVLVYNTALLLWLRRIEAARSETTAARTRLARTQVGLDWLVLLTLLHLSGGLESPLLLIVVLQVAIGTLLLDRREARTFSLAGIALLGALGAGEATGVVRHLHVATFLPGELATQPIFVLGMLTSVATVGMLGFYLTSVIAENARRSGEQLAALYLSAQAVTSTLELHEVLEGLMRETVEVMGASGASIGLLDRTGTQIEPAASYGLSERYLSKGPLLLLPGYIQTDVMNSGEPTFIHTDEDRDRLQYPDVVKAEGINTILYVRLPGKTRPLGLMRAYSNRPHAFTPEDARFLATIAAQGAGAIENALAFQALRQLDAEKSRFVRVVTHELRAPVKGAQTMLMAILGGYAGELGGKPLEIIKRIERRLGTLQLLVDDLLQLAAGRSELEVEEVRPIPVVEAVQQAIGQVEPQSVAKQQQLDLRCDPSCQQLQVQATLTGIMRILTNLIGNAVKYTPEHGQITVAVRRLDRQVEIEVRDTGIGIPGESLGKLFTEFYRAPNAKAFETGTGLGLVIVRDLVERFGGTLAVHSIEGEGTTFNVRLPMAAG